MNKAFPLFLAIILSTPLLRAQQFERYNKLLDTNITSEFLGYEKKISVIVPFEWQANIDRDFPLIVIFDSQNQRSHGYILNAIDYLTSTEQMPSAVIVSIHSDDHRYLETLHKDSDPAGLAEENERFLFEELLPLAEQEFHASNFRIFIGHSRYGYFTSALFASKLHELTAVISLSPFFEQKNVDLVKTFSDLIDADLSGTKYYRFAIGNDYPEDYARMAPVVEMIDGGKIDAKGFLFEQADHNATPGMAIIQSLYGIFEYWAMEQSFYFDNSNSDFNLVPELGRKITDHYGNRLIFALGILNGKGWHYFNNTEFSKAIKAWQILLEEYPNFSEAYLYIIAAERELGLDNSKTIAAFRKSLVVSAIYSAAEKQELLLELDQ